MIRLILAALLAAPLLAAQGGVAKPELRGWVQETALDTP
jgi:hypothetical protein